MIKQVHIKKLVMILLGVLLSILFVNCNVAAQLETEFLNSTQGFSQVATVTSDGITTVYISGQVGIRNGEVANLFSEQVDIVFANMAVQLNAAGASFADVVKLTGYIVDIDGEKVASYSQGRERHFPSGMSPPASTVIGVSGLVFPALQVEVEAIAVIEE